MKYNTDDFKYIGTISDAINIYSCKCGKLFFTFNNTSFLEIKDLIGINNQLVGWLWKHKSEYKIPIIDFIKEIPFLKKRSKPDGKNKR